MPRPGNVVEKPKNFKDAIKRLIKELKSFYIIIIISLILAFIGSILTINTPNLLKDLTNEISSGLVINTKKLEEFNRQLSANVESSEFKEKIVKILDIKIDNNTINNIMMSNLSDESKNKFREFLNNPSDLSILDDDIYNIILNDSYYEDKLITKNEKINLIKSQDKYNLSDNIASILLKDIKIDNTIINYKDQNKYISMFSNYDIKIKKNNKKIYNLLTKMPNSIKKIIEPPMDLNKIKNMTLLILIIYIISALLTYIESIIMTVVSNKFAYSLRKKIIRKINFLPLSFFDNNKSGDVLSRVTNDVDQIAMTMNQSLVTLVSALTLFIGTLFMMFTTNILMSVTAVLSAFIGFIFMFIILSRSQKYFVKRQKYLGDLNSHIEEVYSSLNVIKVYNGVEKEKEEFNKHNKLLFTSNRKSQFLSGLMIPIMIFIGNFGYVAVCIVGALLTMNNKISFGVIVAFISYIRLFTSPLQQIAQSFNQLQSTAASSERVFSLLDKEELEDEKDKKSLEIDKIKGNIEFKNVVFKYEGNNKPTIKDFSIKIKNGQKIAIVGPTGAGKTTMVNLLMKFYNITDGDIIIDGKSINNIKREDISKLFTMVLQDTWLFDGSILDNIKFNRINVSLEEVMDACKKVGIDHFIKTLPKGYYTNISDADGISSGQKQLITIARGMIEDAPFLILDEATSNVDTRTEELVQMAMDKLSEGKTSFIIAHRLSTIKNADLILVMKEGNIVEVGNHDELLKKKGDYAELYNSQFEL